MATDKNRQQMVTLVTQLTCKQIAEGLESVTQGSAVTIEHGSKCSHTMAQFHVYMEPQEQSWLYDG